MDAREAVSFLVGSESRIQILRATSEKSLRPTELAEQCSCARETVQRNLSQFLDRGWIGKSNHQYEITTTGEMVLVEYDRLERTVKLADKLDLFLSNGFEQVRHLSNRTLADLTVTTATADNPHAAIDRYVEILQGDYVSHFRGITPIVSRIFNEVAAEVIGPETDMELIIDETVLRTSKLEYKSAFQRALELDQFTLRYVSQRIGLGIAIFDEHVFVGAYDETGNLVACLDGSNEGFYRWAQKIYEEYRSQSHVIETEEDL